MLNVLGMVGCKPVVTPALDSKVELDDIKPLKVEDVTKYKKASGIAIYLATGRADIMYAVKKLARRERRLYWP